MWISGTVSLHLLSAVQTGLTQTGKITGCVILVLAALLIIYSLVKGKTAKTATGVSPAETAVPAAVPNNEEEEETFAVLISVISEAVQAPIDSFRVVGIKQL